MGISDLLFEFLCGGGELPSLSSAISALGTGGESAEDVLLRGGTSGQALKSAAANGASDIIVSLLLMKLAGKIKKGEGSTLKNLGASLGLNAAQTIGGNAIRETTDNMIMGEKSHYESQLRRYIQQQGLSREEAEKAVLLDELRATGSIAPFVSGLMLYGASWGMRMLDDVNILRQRHEYVPPEKNFDPDVTPYTQEDFRIAQILQDEAPKKTFEDDSNDGIMGKQMRENP